MTELKDMKLNSVQQKFVLHWGEMGTRWGVNRTVAQIHALLYLSPKPLPADEIAETLDVARSNVSTSLRELQAWGIVRMVHVMDDKRDHFEALSDVWEMVRVIVDERKRREIDPTLAVLRECVREAQAAGEEGYTAARLQALQTFFEGAVNWYDQVRRWPSGALVKLMQLGDKILKLLGTNRD